MSNYHIPVLLKKSVDLLDIKPNGVYLDLTFGGGGHSREILSRLGKDGKLYSFDQDKDTIANAPTGDNRFNYVLSNFRYISNFMRYYGIEKVDGILADLGVSSHHFDEAKRGFSFRFDGELDMRMNQEAKLTAKEVLNNYSEEQLADVFYYYGEIRTSRALARLIVNKRKEQEFSTIFKFIDAIKPFTKKDEKKELARIFQALRIEVNKEMDALKEMLLSANTLLNKGGRAVIISYHSLEDRLVKNLFKTGNFEGKAEKDFFGNLNAPFKIMSKQVSIPSSEEIEENPRSRSAKMRVGIKL